MRHTFDKQYFQTNNNTKVGENYFTLATKQLNLWNSWIPSESRQIELKKHTKVSFLRFYYDDANTGVIFTMKTETITGF